MDHLRLDKSVGVIKLLVILLGNLHDPHRPLEEGRIRVTESFNVLIEVLNQQVVLVCLQELPVCVN